jgi:hypothetical protein
MFDTLRPRPGGDDSAGGEFEFTARGDVFSVLGDAAVAIGNGTAMWPPFLLPLFRDPAISGTGDDDVSRGDNNSTADLSG